MSVINSPLFHTLPKEIVNTILLFTGKFVVDKRDKTKLRSTLDMSEYQHINKCLQHAARADYYRHPLLLFLKPPMHPLPKYMLCIRICIGCQGSFIEINSYIREYNCARCNKIINQQSKSTEQEYKLRKDYVYKYKHHRKIVCKNIKYNLKNKIGKNTK